MEPSFVYILSSKNRRVYAGMTTDLFLRIWQHKVNWFPRSFTSRYNINRLVYMAELPSVDDAIAWEKRLKDWAHDKKAALIEERNPRWNDLAWNWYEGVEEAKHAIREGRSTGLWPNSGSGSPFQQ